MKRAIRLNYIFGLIALVALHNLAIAGDKISYQNWWVELSGRNNEAYTIADPKTSFGVFCSGEQCLFYLHQGLNCTPGSKYSVLMNSSLVSTALGMECTNIGGNTFQILTPFDAVLNATQSDDSIGFAVALQSGAFAVTRFSLEGAKPAISRLLTEVANSKRRDEKLTPQLLIPPVVTPKPAPNLAPKSPSKELSI